MAASQGQRLLASSAYEAARQFATYGTTLHSLVGYSGAAQFVQLHDSATVPAEGAVPLIVLAVESAKNFSLLPALRGLRFNRGLYICNSSTGPTKTLGAANCFFSVNVE